MPKHDESLLQAQIVKELRHRGIMVFMVGNDSPAGDAVKAGRMIALGLLPGVSDLIVVLQARCVFLELKTPTGRLSEAQVKFQEKVEALGHQYAVARSLQEAIDVLSLH